MAEIGFHSLKAVGIRVATVATFVAVAQVLAASSLPRTPLVESATKAERGSGPIELAHPGAYSSAYAVLSALSPLRPTVDRLRHFLFDSFNDSAVRQGQRFLAQVRAILSYADRLALACTGSVSHLATSIPPPPLA